MVKIIDCIIFWYFDFDVGVVNCISYIWKVGKGCECCYRCCCCFCYCGGKFNVVVFQFIQFIYDVYECFNFFCFFNIYSNIGVFK